MPAFAFVASSSRKVSKSLKTERISVAQLRLAGLQKEERKKAKRGELLNKGKVLFEAAPQIVMNHRF